MVDKPTPPHLPEINKNASQALYSQLEEIMRDGIENEVWSPGEAIPSERELSRIYGLSRMTVRRALDRLVTAGLLYRVDGKGTFVSEPKVSFQALSLAGLREQAVRHGHSPSSTLLGVEQVIPPEKVAEALELEPDTPVFLMDRVRYANDVPLALHRSYIPVARCPTLPEMDLVSSSLYTILREEYGIQVSHASETLESTLATRRESLLLNVSSGSPMLLLRILLKDQDEAPVEYVKVVFRGDKVQLHVNI